MTDGLDTGCHELCEKGPLRTKLLRVSLSG